MSPIVILIALVLCGFIAYARSGKGGELGRRIRNSDYWAWRDAVNEAEQRLSELKSLEPKYEGRIK